MRGKPPTPEALLTRSVRQLLNAAGIFHWKEFQTLGSYRGVSDVIGIYKGQMIALEIKSDRGRVSPEQQSFIDRINAEGGIAAVVRSIDDVINILGLQDRFLRFK